MGDLAKAIIVILVAAVLICGLGYLITDYALAESRNDFALVIERRMREQYEERHYKCDRRDDDGFCERGHYYTHTHCPCWYLILQHESDVWERAVDQASYYKAVRRETYVQITIRTGYWSGKEYKN
jgi:hypothetical protein